MATHHSCVSCRVRILDEYHAKLRSEIKRTLSCRDQYHALFEEYRDFVDLTLSSTDPDYEEKEREYEVLSEKRKQININSPRTTNKKYASLTTEEVFGTMETTPEELDRLLGEGPTED